MSLIQALISIFGIILWAVGILTKDWWLFAEGSTTVLGSLLFLIIDRLDKRL